MIPVDSALFGRSRVGSSVEPFLVIKALSVAISVTMEGSTYFLQFILVSFWFSFSPSPTGSDPAAPMLSMQLFEEGK